MRLIGVVVLLALLGCGAGADDENHGYGTHYDQLGAAGMRLRYSPTLPPESEWARVSTYELAFQEAQKCTGLSAPAPFVIIVEKGAIAPAQGRYLKNPSLILIDVSLGTADTIMRHESVHYLLDMATGSSDRQHASPLFLRCSLTPAAS